MNAARGATARRLGGRLGVLALLLLACWDPLVPWIRAPIHLIVLVDDSLSMRRGFVDAAWGEMMQGVQGAPARSEVTLIRFGSGTATEFARRDMTGLPAVAVPARRRPLDNSATNIETAITQALASHRPAEPTVIVLISDGAETHGSAEAALRRTAAAGVPVLVIAPADGSERNPVQLEDVQMPDVAMVGDRVPLTVAFSGAPQTQLELCVSVDGEIAAAMPLTVDSSRFGTARIWLEARARGVVAVAATLIEGGGDCAQAPVAPMAQRSALLNVDGPAPLLVVSADPDGGLAHRLQSAGWGVVPVEPTRFLQYETRLDRHGAIVLDDIAISDMPLAAWTALIDAVRTRGTGLVVLGGPASFGAGGYRHSRLEDILPVTAEGRQPQSPASIVFVLDKSGSMGQGPEGSSRWALANFAVEETLRNVAAGDNVGIVAFDVMATTLRSLSPYAGGDSGLERVSALGPGGGTRLAPALDAALTQLRGAATEQRLLVLVTDGVVAGEDLSRHRRELAEAGIDVIALAVGVGDDPALESLEDLAGINDGQLLRVADTAMLPRLMQQQVSARRDVSERGSFGVESVAPRPFLREDDTVPALTGYMVSMARPGAQTHLATGNGDPLLVSQQVGAGRVVVLPGGLGEWAASWWRWAQFGEFLGRVLGWLTVGQNEATIAFGAQDRPGGLMLTIDGVQGAEWSRATDAVLSVRDPAGLMREIRMPAVAPGRYQVLVPTNQAGRYLVTAQLGEARIQRELLHGADFERDSAFSGANTLKRWLGAGLIRVWPGDSGLDALWPRQPASTRGVWILLALLGYLALMLHEHGVLHAAGRIGAMRWRGARRGWLRERRVRIESNSVARGE